MKRFAFSSIAIALLFAGCAKHPEIEFAGTVTGVRQCTSASFLDQSVGYMVQLDYPDSIGATITTDEGTATGVIVLYEPPRRIMLHDHIHGTFYLDDKYSRSNCSLHYTDFELPEGVFLRVDVD